jgi:hypothetical protein
MSGRLRGAALAAGVARVRDMTRGVLR